MSRKNSSDGGGGGVVVFAVFVVIGLLMRIPPAVWLAILAIVVVVAVMGLIAWAVNAAEKRRIEAEKQAIADREARTRREKQHRVDTLGRDNASLVESALAAVQRVTESEAAREGWLGDVDFTADLRGISDSFAKAYALREVTGRLAALKNPSADDRKLLAEARKTVADLERGGIERVELIGKCAKEAKAIDTSLRAERDDALVAGQRAELHAQLSAMLYGIEAMPNTTATSSAADAVLARVQAYREIKSRIVLTRQ